MRQHAVVILAVAIVATLIVSGVVAVGAILAVDTAAQVTLDAREAAARDTVVVNARSQLSVVRGWTVLLVASEASYHTRGMDPVDSRWGLGSQGTIAGEDAGPVLEAVNDAPVRFLVVGQCAGTEAFTTAVAFAPGLAPVTGDPPGAIPYAPFPSPLVPCDGHAHATASDRYVIPPSDIPAGQWSMFWFAALDQHAASASRSVLFVAPADTPLPDLAGLEALAEQAFGGALP